nr:MAG TPA: hypothetical protein [Caudoviricetes sp.]
MKFQKFVKALGSDGIVYNRKNGERWLASDKVFMKIPEDIRSVTCTEVADMPEFVENIINYDSFTDPCDLHKAVMPYADGVIKDCVRIYAEGKALVIKRPAKFSSAEDEEVLGLIFPTDYEE